SCCCGCSCDDISSTARLARTERERGDFGPAGNCRIILRRRSQTIARRTESEKPRWSGSGGSTGLEIPGDHVAGWLAPHVIEAILSAIGVGDGGRVVGIRRPSQETAVLASCGRTNSCACPPTRRFREGLVKWTRDGLAEQAALAGPSDELSLSSLTSC